MMDNVLFNYVVNGVIVEGPMSYQSVLERTGLKDTVRFTELGYIEHMPTPEMPEITPEQILAGVRNMRTFLLEKSDWTQIADAGLTEEKKLEWAAYRQELRDMPYTYRDTTDLLDVTAPTPPTK